MSLYQILCAGSGALTFTYGAGLLVVPDFFMGSFIYDANVWQNFKHRVVLNPTDRKVYHHIMLGLALTWISWSVMAYYPMYGIKDYRG